MTDKEKLDAIRAEFVNKIKTKGELYHNSPLLIYMLIIYN